MRRTTPRWAVLALALGAQALAAPPPALTVQGVLRDGSGALQSATVTVLVSVYDAETAGTRLFGPSQTNGVPVTNGLFTVNVTDATLPGIVAASSAAWLEVTVGSDVFPRTRLTPAVFASAAGDALKLGGVEAAGYQRKLTTPDCGAGKHLQGVAADGTPTCAADGTGDGTSITATSNNVLSVAFAGSGTASTAARSDHTHGLSCVTTAVSGAAGATSVVAFCPSGTMTGGGCTSSTGYIRNSFPACNSSGVFCICLPGSCGPRWSCSSAGGTAAEVLTAYVTCCTTAAP